VNDKFYYKDGSVLDKLMIYKELHREDGPAIEWADGCKEWWIDGQRHRVDGPACEWSDGGKEWWYSGKLHRIDGPACEDINGSKYWWVDDKHLTEEQFNNHPKVRHYRFQLLLEEVLRDNI